MKTHWRVRNVLLSHNTSALTLDPVTWYRDSETEVTDDGFPAWEDTEPSDPNAEPYEAGGKATEVRIEGSTDWKPGDFLTMTVEATEHTWKPEV